MRSSGKAYSKEHKEHSKTDSVNKIAVKIENESGLDPESAQ
jgi:hypothetical protein